MPFEILVGLLVADQDTYARYRAEIAPLLEAAGGGFQHDFEVSQTLKSEAGIEMNRVFVLRFPDRGAKERFFNDPRYMEIRARLFEKAVREMAVIAEYAPPGGDRR